MTYSREIYTLIANKKPPRKFVNRWIKALNNKEFGCPCYKQGYIAKTDISKPKGACPLGYENVESCLKCSLSKLWNKAPRTESTRTSLINYLGQIYY